ncbi:MAG: DUF1501 domain-containing protein [Candidatus Binatia bacterium]
MGISRRDFIKTGAATLSAFMIPGLRPLRSYASTTDPVLIVLYLRGGADGLTMVVPAFDPLYYANRPTIQVPPGSELPLNDGFGFGLNPALADLLPLYQSGDLAIIHASGSPDPSRSHFDAQDFMDHASPGDKAVVEGWINRYLTVAGGGLALSGVTLAKKKTKAMLGPAPTLAFSSIEKFSLAGQSTPERRAALETRYGIEQGTLLGDTVTDAFDAVDVIASVDTTTSVIYPDGDLGPLLKDAAALIKADVGIRVIAIDLGGWDHHSGQIARMNALGTELSSGLAAFYSDLGPCAATSLTLCMTEFGRRVGENGGGGSDHGHGGIMLALGGGIAGGRVLLDGAAWPGLEEENLFIGQDLQATTDFRNIFAEALGSHMQLSTPAMAPIFPDFSVDPANYPGLYL